MFVHVERKKKILMEELCVFDMIEEERDFGVEERLKKTKLVRELERSILMEEVKWGQKSRVLWLRRVTVAAQMFFMKWLTLTEGRIP